LSKYFVTYHIHVTSSSSFHLQFPSFLHCPRVFHHSAHSDFLAIKTVGFTRIESLTHYKSQLIISVLTLFQIYRSVQNSSSFSLTHFPTFEFFRRRIFNLRSNILQSKLNSFNGETCSRKILRSSPPSFFVSQHRFRRRIARRIAGSGTLSLFSSSTFSFSSRRSCFQPFPGRIASISIPGSFSARFAALSSTSEHSISFAGTVSWRWRRRQSQPRRCGWPER